MISVIIPLYNAEKTILSSLESVKNQCGNYQFEIIVINDGSTDCSEEIVNQFKIENPTLNIILLNQKNKGVSSARNAGLRIAKGEYIALLDADDIWLPQKTERQLKFLEDKSLEIDFISCRLNNHKLLFPYFSKNNLAKVTFRKLLIRNGIPSPTAIFKRKILENTGFFDDQQKYAEDHNYWLKIAIKNKMYILDESLVIAGNGKRTFGVSGLSANLKNMERGFAKTLKEMYDLEKLNFFEFLGLRLFYKAKYIFLLIRVFYYRNID